MNKRIIGVIVVVALIVLAVLGIFKFRGKQTDTPKVDTSQMAQDIQKYQEDRSVDDIKNDLDTELTQEQKDAANYIIDQISIPDNTVVNDDGDLVVKDEDGNEIEVSISPDDTRIDEAETDEELEAIYDELRARLEGNKNSTDTTPSIDSNNQTNTSTTDNQSGNNQEDNNSQPSSSEGSSIKQQLEDLESQGYLRPNVDGTDYSDADKEILGKLLGGN